MEVCSPLGAARGKYKVTLMYAQLLNAPNHVRSRLDNIFLVGVVLRKTLAAIDNRENSKGAGLRAAISPKAGMNPGSTSFTASLSRLDRDDGVNFYVSHTDSPQGGCRYRFEVGS